VDMDNQTKFTQAKLAKFDTLMRGRCQHMVLFAHNQEREPGGNKIGRKVIAQGYLMHPPFKIPILDAEHKKDIWWVAQCEWAEREARDLLLQSEIVEDKVVYLSEIQKREVRNADNAYEAFKCLSNLVYQKGDVNVLIAFEQELAMVLKDKKLLKTGVSAW
jgi:hypothetical protein